MHILKIAVVTGMVLLAGCGFYLKGQRPLPEELRDVRIQNSVSPVVESELERALRTEIVRRGGRIGVIRNASILRIVDVKQEEQVLSLGPDGKAIEYLLTITVTFALERDSGMAVPQQSLTVYEEYSFDKREVVAAEHESRSITNALYRELAELILIRIETSLNS